MDVVNGPLETVEGMVDDSTYVLERLAEAVMVTYDTEFTVS